MYMYMYVCICIYIYMYMYTCVFSFLKGKYIYFFKKLSVFSDRNKY